MKKLDEFIQKFDLNIFNFDLYCNTISIINLKEQFSEGNFSIYNKIYHSLYQLFGFELSFLDMQTIPQTKSEVQDESQNQNKQNQKRILQEPISIFEAIKKNLRCNEKDCKLVMHCKSLTMCKSLAQLIHEESQKNKRFIIMLIDLYDQEIEQIFNQIVCIRSKNLLLGDKFMTDFKMKRLNDVVKQKRKQFYHCSGAYAVSSQVFLKDILRFQQIINVNNINKIVFRISQKISNYYNSIGWIATLLKISQANIKIVYLCRQIQYYSEFQSLQALYRTIFCSKLVIWPFGRSQIHKKLAQIRNSANQDFKKVSTVQKLTQFKHYLQMDEQYKKTAQILQNLVEIVQKNYNKSHGNSKVKGMQILYKQSIYRQLYHLNLFQNEINEFVNLRFLFIALCNCDSLMFLTILSSLRYDEQTMHTNGGIMSNKTCIWNSNNSTVIQLISQLQKTVKRNVLSLRKINKDQQKQVNEKQRQKQKEQKNQSTVKNQQKQEQFDQYQNEANVNNHINNKKDQLNPIKKIDLVQLIMNYHYDKNQNQLAQIYDNYQAVYQMQYWLDIHLSPNPKLIEIIQILQKSKIQRQQQTQILKAQLIDLKDKKSKVYRNLISNDKSMQDAIQLQILSELQPQVLLINCPNQLSKKYLHRQLFSYIHNCQYVQYLRALYRYLHVQRSHRIAKLKLIYTRIKHKKQYMSQTQEQERQSNKLNSSNQIIQNQQQSSLKNLSIVQRQQRQQNRVVQDFSQQKHLFQQKFKIQIQYCEGKKHTNKEEEQNKKQKQKHAKKEERLKKQRQKNNQVKKIGWLQRMTQNEVILEEYLYKQLSILIEIISHYQHQVFTEEQSRFCFTQPASRNNNNDGSNQTKPNKKKINQLQKKNQQQQQDSQHNSKPFSFSLKNKEYKQYSETQTIPTYSFENSTLQVQKMFIQEINRNKFEFLDKEKLLIGPSYQSRTIYNIYSQKNKQQKLLIVSLFSPQKSSPNSDPVTKFSQMIMLMNPSKCVFYSPHPSQIRNLYIHHAQKKLPKLKQVRVLSFKNSFEVATVEHQVKKQDQAFWNIAQNRSKLSQYKQDPNIRIKKLQMNDKFQKTIDFMNYVMKKNESIPISKFGMYRINPENRRIIIDTRQFKSALPCYLYFYGFTIIPIQLQTGDYILSQQIGIQKKSVQTKDLHLSLKSFRLDDQIKRMCQKFKKPYLLIQCEESESFKKQSFYERNGNGTLGQYNGNAKIKQKDSHKFWIRQRLAELIKKYPKIRIIWSNSVTTTCQYFKMLKHDNNEPQIGKYLKNSKQQDLRNSNDTNQIQENQAQQLQEEIALQKMQIQI